MAELAWRNEETQTKLRTCEEERTFLLNVRLWRWGVGIIWHILYSQSRHMHRGPMGQNNLLIKKKTGSSAVHRACTVDVM